MKPLDVTNYALDDFSDEAIAAVKAHQNRISALSGDWEQQQSAIDADLEEYGQQWHGGDYVVAQGDDPAT